MVLDFKSKVAIDLIGGNGKVSLVSRALREGILHSGNKGQTENISIVFTESKKELLQVNKNALKYIAETYGYDFQKPYKVVGILGKFTANSIKKIIKDSNALLFMTNDDNINIVELNNGKFKVNDLNSNYAYSISTFYSKGKFEEVRKSGEAAIYVIQQDRQYFREIKKIDSGRTGVYVNNRMKYFDEMSDSEIARINLKRRLEDYKANKRRKEAQITDYTKEMARFDSEFISLKTEIISRFTNANTPEEYNILSDVINYKLVRLVRDIANFKNSAITRDFRSKQQAQESIDNISSAITKILDKLA